MALEIFWTNEAQAGLDDIVEYLQNNWTDKEIRKFFRRLEEFLEKIQEAPERQKESLRKAGAKEYQHSRQTTIFYSFDNEGIYILRLWSNAQNDTRLRG